MPLLIEIRKPSVQFSGLKWKVGSLYAQVLGVKENPVYNRAKLNSDFDKL